MLFFECNVQDDLNLHHIVLSLTALFLAIVILIRHMLCVAHCVSTGMTRPDAVTSKCNPLPLAGQDGSGTKIVPLRKSSSQFRVPLQDKL